MRTGFIPFRVGKQLITTLPAKTTGQTTPIPRPILRLPRRVAAPVIEPPTGAEMTANFAVAMARYAASGFKHVSEGEYQARRAACQACPLWDDAARAGLGKCNHKKCGCTRLKLLIASQSCPDGKWPPLTA